jgi:multisubunit Na+/H+ antiporter MnhB subunit
MFLISLFIGFALLIIFMWHSWGEKKKAIDWVLLIVGIIFVLFGLPALPDFLSKALGG